MPWTSVTQIIVTGNPCEIYEVALNLKEMPCPTEASLYSRFQLEFCLYMNVLHFIWVRNFGMNYLKQLKNHRIYMLSKRKLTV